MVQCSISVLMVTGNRWRWLLLDLLNWTELPNLIRLADAKNLGDAPKCKDIHTENANLF